MRRAPTPILALAVALLACGGPPKVDLGDAGTPVPAKTTLSPEPGPFNDRIAVSFTTDIPATVFVTTDGSDPSVESPGRKVGPSPLAFELTQTTTLKYFSRSELGLDEPVSSATFVRAGAVKGTISGVVIVDTLAVSQALALTVNGAQQSLPLRTSAGEVPFSLTGLQSGTYRLRALADRNGDGQLTPLLDLTSETVTVELDLADPFKASAERVRIHLGASRSGLGTLKGTVTFAEPPAGQNLSIAALDPSAMASGADPAALLGQLQNGYQVFTSSTGTSYPFVITDLEPGTYVPVAILSGFGSGALAMNFQGNPLSSVSVAADQTATRNFTFGGVALSGSAAFTPPASDGGTSGGFIYGVVAAKTFNFSEGLQAVLMPTLFSPTGTGQVIGVYGGVALRENATFALRAFPSTDAQNPLTAALGWTIAVLGAPPPHATVSTQSSDVAVNFSF